MPFVTSELYAALGHRRQLAVHSWPAADDALHDADATRAFDALRAAVAAARSLKSELGLSPQDRLNVAVEGDLAPTVHENARVVESIARVNLSGDLEGRTLSLVEQGVTVRAPLEGTVDIADWVGKQKKRLAEFDKQIKQAQGKLSNEGFVARAPPKSSRRRNAAWPTSARSGNASRRCSHSSSKSGRRGRAGKPRRPASACRPAGVARGRVPGAGPTGVPLMWTPVERCATTVNPGGCDSTSCPPV